MHSVYQILGLDPAKMSPGRYLIRRGCTACTKACVILNKCEVETFQPQGDPPKRLYDFHSMTGIKRRGSPSVVGNANQHVIIKNRKKTRYYILELVYMIQSCRIYLMIHANGVAQPTESTDHQNGKHILHSLLNLGKVF
jgi:hypothetical protein